MSRSLKYLTLNNWRVYAGPFKDAPQLIDDKRVKAMCLKAEAAEPEKKRADYWFPITDFSIPQVRPCSLALAWLIWMGVARKKRVYIGCMGGTGRTGFMLALLARIAYNMDGGHAISRVRRYYREHAVKTWEQEGFVREFPIKTLRTWYRICRVIQLVN